MYLTRNKKKNIALIVVVIALFLALFSGWEYGFFTMLRFVVCAIMAYVAWMAYEEQEERWVWIFGFIAVLFNPFFPIYLGRETWIVVDVLVGMFLFMAIFFFRLDKKEDNRFSRRNT